MTHNQKVVLVTVASVAAVIIVGVFLYLRKRNREFDHDENQSQKDELEFADLNTREESVASAGQSIVKVKVPQHVVGIIIGKDGTSIKQLRAEFGVRFNFDRDEVTEKPLGNESLNKRADRILEIRGQREQVRVAEQKINAIIAETPKYVETEVFVPMDTCGRIIGKGGQNIREMCCVSGAKIVIERSEFSSLGNQRKISLSGTTVQVEYAKLLIKEKLEQVKADRYKYRNEGDDFKSNTFYDFPTVMIPNTGEYFQVFVSSFQAPDNFWVQLVSKESTKLDMMTNELVDVYGKLNPEEERLESGTVGDICIAPYEDDGQWYRAAISKINQDRTAELCYLDFGDTGCVKLDEIKKIRPEHKHLHGQAVHCQLPIKPSGDAWTDEATEEFRNITHCAQWKPIMSKIIYHQKTPEGEVPVLQLVDTSQHEDVDVAATMVQKGYAVSIEDSILESGDSKEDNKTETMVTAPDIPVDVITGNDNEISNNIIVEETIEFTEVTNQESGLDYFLDGDINLDSQTQTEVDTSIDNNFSTLTTESEVPNNTSPANVSSSSSSISVTMENNEIPVHTDVQNSEVVLPEKMKTNSTEENNKLSVSAEKMKIKNEEILTNENHYEDDGKVELEKTLTEADVYEEEIHLDKLNNVESEMHFIPDKNIIVDSPTKTGEVEIENISSQYENIISDSTSDNASTKTSEVEIENIAYQYEKIISNSTSDNVKKYTAAKEIYEVKPSNSVFAGKAVDVLQNASQKTESTINNDVDDGGVYLVSSEYLHNISGEDTEVVSEPMLCAEDVSELESANDKLFNGFNGCLPETCIDETSSVDNVEAISLANVSDNITIKNHKNDGDTLSTSIIEEISSISNVVPGVTIGNQKETIPCEISEPILSPNVQVAKSSQAEVQAPEKTPEFELLQTSLDNFDDILSTNIFKSEVNNGTVITSTSLQTKQYFVDEEKNSCSEVKCGTNEYQESEIDKSTPLLLQHLPETHLNGSVKVSEKPFIESEKVAAQEVSAQDIGRANIKDRVNQIQEHKRSHVEDIISQVINENITEAGKNENKHTVTPADVTPNDDNIRSVKPGLSTDKIDAEAVSSENDDVKIVLDDYETDRNANKAETTTKIVDLLDVKTVTGPVLCLTNSMKSETVGGESKVSTVKTDTQIDQHEISATEMEIPAIKPETSSIKPEGVAAKLGNEGTETNTKVPSEDTKSSTKTSQDTDITTSDKKTSIPGKSASLSTECLLKDNEIILNNLNNSLRDTKMTKQNEGSTTSQDTRTASQDTKSISEDRKISPQGQKLPTLDNKSSPSHIETSSSNRKTFSQDSKFPRSDSDEDYVEIGMKQVGGDLVPYVSDQNLNSLGEVNASGEHSTDKHSTAYEDEDDLQKSLDETSRKNVRHKSSMEMARENLLLIVNTADESDDDDSFFSAQSDITITSNKSDIEGINYFTADADSGSYFTADSRAMSPSNKSGDSFFSFPSPRGSKLSMTSVESPVRKLSPEPGSVSKFEINVIDEKSNLVLPSESILPSSETKETVKAEEKIGRETTV